MALNKTSEIFVHFVLKCFSSFTSFCSLPISLPIQALGQFKHMLASREFSGTISLIDIGECDVSDKSIYMSLA